MKLLITFYILLLLPGCSLNAQDVYPLDGNQTKGTSITGFVRSGFYVAPEIKNTSSLSSVYSELSLKLEASGSSLFSASGETRIRYGQEFGKTSEAPDIRELFVKISTERLDISLGQQIIKWGKADFTNPVSKLSSRDYSSRLPEADDPDQGNLLVRARWFPFHSLTIEAVTGPFYRPSVLITEPMDIPSYISIGKLPDLLTDRYAYCYGIRAGFSVHSADFSFSWYEGPDPLPGFRLDRFDLDLSAALPLPRIGLSLSPSRIRNLGLEFETIFGSTGFRGETAWTFPTESCVVMEYAQCEQLAWATGIDRSSGKLRLYAEYSGKFLPGFQPAGVEPILGTDPDFNTFLLLLSQPDFDAGEYIRKQVGAFNRLAFYQLEEWYHSFSARAEAEFFNGILNTSMTAQYNLSTEDLVLRSDFKAKPSDGLTIYGGLELYRGPDGSVFRIIDEFMSGFFLGVKIDFSVL